MPMSRRVSCDCFNFQLNHPRHGLTEQVVHGQCMDQRRVQPGLEFMAVELGDHPSRRFQLQLPAQTELRVKPPTT